MQALEKSREHRFATATAFLQALEDAEAPVEASGGIDIGATIAAGSGGVGGLRPAWAAGASVGWQPRWLAWRCWSAASRS